MMTNNKILLGAGTKQAQAREAASPRKKSGSRRQSAGEAFVKSLAHTVGSQIGRQIMRGLLGSLRR